MCNERSDDILLPQFRYAGTRGGGGGGARHPDFLNRGGERLCPHISTRPPNFQTFQHPCSSSKLELHAKPVSLLITINSSLALGCGACVLL